MKNPDHTERRRLLKMLAGAPMLPLGAASLLAGHPARASEDGTPALPSTKPIARPSVATPGAAPFVSAEFISMPAPGLSEPEGMARTTVESAMDLVFADGSRRRVQLGYEAFFMTGDRVPDGKGGMVLAGGYLDIHGAPIMDTSVPGRARPFFSDCPDGMSLLTLAGPLGEADGATGPPTVTKPATATVYAVVQFEYLSRDRAGQDMWARLPSPIAVLTLSQNLQTGQLTLVRYSNVDTAPVHGLWVTCGASLSPWNTHLSSEEYEPDATTARTSASFRAFSRHLYGDARRANPYHYGHLPEITVQPDGTGSIKKHYCMGRISHELVQIMPDQRTALMGDDATNGGLFMFVADRRADLSSGTLYVARWTQTSGTGPGAGTLTWIRLGHATSAEVKELADDLVAADIMDVRTADPKNAAYTRIRFDGKNNWVRLKPGRRQAAAFLETHRYAALVGGTLAFTKMEGTTVNAQDKIAYTAMAHIETSMVDGTSPHLHVEGPDAGAVYQLRLQAGQVDTDGLGIDSEWVPVDMGAVPELVGAMLAAPDALGNRHRSDRISNPDNLKFSEKLRTLFVGEDSMGRVNSFLWAFNVDTRLLSRLLSCPVAAESTGLHAVDDINGWTYITSNFQHTADWNDVHDVVRPVLEPLVKAKYRNGRGASVGYLTAVKINA
ncbi:alkaline phosphatase [Achromobacter spanius]|uniref:Alkaline phosphatase n=1 Tax=Achromobacter spanius TaxID=217203 RepID=A0A2S5GM85_9BURK|nr:alkaline phosphatase PhoX [Achromobacter spanius]PPA74054.1 alkaline phosphatase [Achromobacter spanius]